MGGRCQEEGEWEGERFGGGGVGGGFEVVEGKGQRENRVISCTHVERGGHGHQGKRRMKQMRLPVAFPCVCARARSRARLSLPLHPIVTRIVLLALKGKKVVLNIMGRPSCTGDACVSGVIE